MIQVENIVKTYGSTDNIVKALDQVSIDFREKEFVSILGPSGCGKTTLLNILGGLDRYDSGDIKINNVSTKNFKDKDWDTYRNHYIGFVFQSYNLIPHLSVVENVELALSIGGISKSEKRKLAINALEQVGLKAQAKKKPNQLSGGQMQRVAIARAIVNNPQIILADEPTGALDSETSIQVMDILKKISKKQLVIMVTHNKEIAEKYSTRILSMLDGKLINDSNPINKNTKKTKNQKPGKTRKSAMSLFTAFALSFKNLFAKKAKTLLVSFAGSIGIIGIALVLAVSTGMTNYVNNVQSEALAGYPISISTISLDYDKITEYMENMGGSDNDSDNSSGSAGGSGGGSGGSSAPTQMPDNKINIVSLSAALGKFAKYNYLGDEFITYIKNYAEEDAQKSEAERNITNLKFEYANNLFVYTDYKGIIKRIDTTMQTSSLSGSTSSNFFVGIEDKSLVLKNYDIFGTYPQNKNEVCLVVDEENSFSSENLTMLGIDCYNSDGTIKELKYSDIINSQKTYKLVFNDQYFTPDEESNPTEFYVPNDSSQADCLKMYNNSQAEELKITAILKLKKKAKTKLFGTGIMYTPELAEFVYEKNSQSLIVQKTNDLALDQNLYIPFTVDITELKQFFGELGTQLSTFATKQDIINYVKKLYNYDMTPEKATNLACQMLGASTIPVGIYIYSNSFEAKANIVDALKIWNESEAGQKNQIYHNDSTEFLADTLGALINIISYVLIAFAAISLVVSSIMIGIITYTSVIERTKEIGVLRSMGARKKDISRVFNMETFIIGLTSGLIGVIVSFILTFPISALITSMTGGSVTSRLAILKFSDMAILVLISVVLTLIAGIIPSRIAAKKDPVKALRSE